MEWTKQTYNQQYERWMPWIEDQYLRWFTKDNKASYATKREFSPLPAVPAVVTVSMSDARSTENLDQTKVTGVDQVDTLQDGVHNLVAGQVGQGGLLQPVGDMASKEGVNRAERQGKDDNGGYAPSNIPGAGAMNSAASGIAEGTKGAAGQATEGMKSAGGYVGGMFGGGKKEEGQQQQK